MRDGRSGGLKRVLARGYFEQTNRTKVIRRVKLFSIYLNNVIDAKSRQWIASPVLFQPSSFFFLKIEIMQIEQCLKERKKIPVSIR